MCIDKMEQKLRNLDFMSTSGIRKIIKIFQKSLQKITSVLSSKYENFSIFEGGNKMKVSRENCPVKPLIGKMKREKIVLKHKLQRRESVWSNPNKSLLIDSLLRGYIVPPVYTISEDGVQYVIDGVQRLSTLKGFYNDEFAISKKAEPVIIEGTEYNIAGLKFSKLDQVVKDELDSSAITVYEITEYTDKDVREMFRRLNSGKPLNTSQKLTPAMSDELSHAIFDIVSLPFFEKRLTSAQLKSSVDQSIALETLMLCSTNKDNDFASFRGKDKENFIEFYNDKVEPEKIEIIKTAINKLDESLEKDVKIPKTSISVLCFAAYRICKDKKSFEKFALKVSEFLATYDDNTEYKNNLMNGTNSAESVRFRLDYWRNIIRELQ